MPRFDRAVYAWRRRAPSRNQRIRRRSAKLEAAARSSSSTRGASAAGRLFAVRFFVPLFFFAVAAYVWHFNGQDSGAYLLLPFIDQVPGLENDLPAQGQMTWKVLAGFGGVLLLWTIIADLRRPKHRPIPEGEIDDEG